MRQHSFETVGQNFGQQFVGRVTKTNGTEIFHSIRHFHFWNKGNVSVIDISYGCISNLEHLTPY